jgi:DNA-binding XRE family transcriptional regulator
MISLKAARVNSDMSVKEVAEDMNVVSRTVNYWESGKIKIPVGMAYKLCRMYGQDINDIIWPEMEKSNKTI